MVAIGESTTDDLQSWLEILRQLLALRRGGDGITVVNAAVAGQTTTEALRAMGTTLETRPDWILCMIGTNDARRQSPAADRPW
ncbi:SGNH/GDSL hydrolase family protein [Solihabitans fulvus]|uniref:SGNH/GDSL hydrolase family protein n=1 Tax=Solihabitans fulvus TaxID=1892852 RepID=UPI0016620B7C|nr:GDSL-type esterase/lipase family protein [Solihabitans fulvus]